MVGSAVVLGKPSRGPSCARRLSLRRKGYDARLAWGSILTTSALCGKLDIREENAEGDRGRTMHLVEVESGDAHGGEFYDAVATFRNSQCDVVEKGNG